MAYNIRVKNEQGESIVTFGESVRSGMMVSDLWEMHREGKAERKNADCHLEEIYALDNHIAIPFLVKHIESEIESLKGYLKEPKGKWDYQKDLFCFYEKNIDKWKNLTDKILVFHVWDMS
jgi:hypothetical protein